MVSMERCAVDQGRTRVELEATQKGVARTEEGTSNLIGEIRREIRAEIMMENASNANWKKAQQYELSSGEEEQEAAETRDHDKTDWVKHDTTAQVSLDAKIHRLDATSRPVFVVSVMTETIVSASELLTVSFL